MQPIFAQQFIDRYPARDTAGAAHCVLGLLDQFLQQPGAILQRTSVFVAAIVEAPRQEEHGAAEQLAGIDIDDVISRPLGPQRPVAMPAPEIADILLVHGTRLHWIVEDREHRQVLRPHRNLAGIEIGCVHAVVGKLQARERVMGVDCIGNPRQHRHVLLIPIAQLDERGDVARRMDFHLLGAHHAPAAFGLYRPHGGQRRGVAVAHPVAVRHLVEAVLGPDRPDLNWLKENVVSGVAGHQLHSVLRCILSSLASRSRTWQGV